MLLYKNLSTLGLSKFCPPKWSLQTESAITMNPPWIIELELPSGVFSTSQLNEDISPADLDAEIRDVYGLLRLTLDDLMCSPSLSIEREIDCSKELSVPPKIFLMVDYIHDRETAPELCKRLSGVFPDPTPLWTESMFDELRKVVTGFSQSRPEPTNEPARPAVKPAPNA
jgi:hypothetical protein